MSDANNTVNTPKAPEPQQPAEPAAQVQTQPNVPVNQVAGPRIVVVSVRMSDRERLILEKLTQYLYKAGKIQDPSMSEAMRLCLYFTAQEVGKAIEAERYGQQ